MHELTALLNTLLKKEAKWMWTVRFEKIRKSPNI